MKKVAKELILWLGLVLTSILVGGTVYQMIVIVPEFNRDIPNGMIGLAHSHISTKSFWTSPIMPLGFLALVVSVVLNWKNKRRNWLIGSASLAILAEILTIIVVYPQLKIMGIIDGTPSLDTELLTNTIKSWVLLDQIRFWIIVIPSFLLLIKAFSIKVE